MKKYQISVLTAALLLLFAAFPALAEEEIARVAPAAASEVFEGEDKGANVPEAAAAPALPDIGRIAEENEFGLSSVSDNTEDFVNNVNKLTDGELRAKLGGNGYKFLTENYTVENSYKIIMKHFES